MVLKDASVRLAAGVPRVASVPDCRQRGVAYVMALIVSVVILAASTSLLMSSSVSSISNTNNGDLRLARLAAEGGLDFIGYHMRHLELDADVTNDTLLAALADNLQTAMGSSASTGSVYLSGSDVLIPSITPSATTPGSFSALIRFQNDDPSTGIVQVITTGTVTAYDGTTINRSAMAEYEFTPGTTGGPPYDFGGSIFAYGLALNGPISINGGCHIESTGDWNEVIGFYSGYTGTGAILTMDGSGYIEGPGAASADSITAAFPGGGVSINGVIAAWKAEYNWQKNVPELLAQIAVGVEEPEWPVVNAADFEPFVPATPSAHVTAYNDPAQNNAYINHLDSVRVGANTNPTIGADTVINGVVYIESPNTVTFGAGASVNGVIICEDGAVSGGTCRLTFNGGFRLNSVANLPGDSKYDALRSIHGVSILAPGYDMTMANGAVSVGGTVFGKSLALSGGAALNVRGAVLLTGSSTLQVFNGAMVRIDLTDLANADELPTGFHWQGEGQTGGEETPGTFAAVSGSYVELDPEEY